MCLIFQLLLSQADIFFVTDSATLHAHKAFLLHLLPSLASISCLSCHPHEPLVLLLPGVNAQLLQSTLEQAYRQNQVGNLENILGLVMDLPCNHCDQHFESDSEMEEHICEKRPNFTCNLCGTIIQSSNRLSGHLCDNRSKLDSEELKIQLESQELETEEAIVIPTKQEPSELKRAQHWQARRKENRDERKSDESHLGEAAGQSLELEQAIITRLVDIFQL